MSHRKGESNYESSDEEESLSDMEFLKEVLNLMNGYCKVNLVVPQISSFYTNDTLLPINAKINFSTFNKTTNNQTSNLDGKQSNLSNVEFQGYSKPSYSDEKSYAEMDEDDMQTVSPKGKKKKNKFNETMASTSDDQTLDSSTDIDQNLSPEYSYPYENERIENELQSNQQEYQKKLMKNMKNCINSQQSRFRAASSQKNSENRIQNDNLSPQSQCPLCFGLYPTPDIEVHASECSI